MGFFQIFFNKLPHFYPVNRSCGFSPDTDLFFSRSRRKRWPFRVATNSRLSLLPAPNATLTISSLFLAVILSSFPSSPTATRSSSLTGAASLAKPKPSRGQSRPEALGSQLSTQEEVVTGGIFAEFLTTFFKTRRVISNIVFKSEKTAWVGEKSFR